MKSKNKFHLFIIFIILLALSFLSYLDLINIDFSKIDIWRILKKAPLIEKPPTGVIYKDFDFSKNQSLKGWKNKVFKGKTKYWIDDISGNMFLHSKSETTSSALYSLLAYNVKNYPILTWEWRPIKFPNKTGISSKKDTDDYALRVYVIFASGFFTNYRCIEYVWDESVKEGTIQASPFSDKIKQLVVRSGLNAEEWVRENRNVYKDYIKLFGTEPDLQVRAIAVMTDSDGTQDISEGCFKDLKILREENPKQNISKKDSFKKRRRGGKYVQS